MEPLQAPSNGDEQRARTLDPEVEVHHPRQFTSPRRSSEQPAASLDRRGPTLVVPDESLSSEGRSDLHQAHPSTDEEQNEPIIPTNHEDLTGDEEETEETGSEEKESGLNAK